MSSEVKSAAGPSRVRISGGMWRGRYLKVPKGDTRPTQDKVRQALFSMLGPLPPDAQFADLFAGSGVVGVEAASRGASRVVLVENSRMAFPVLKQNLQQFSDEAEGIRFSAVASDAYRFIENYRHTPFDIIFADAPYRHGLEGMNRMLDALRKGNALKTQTIVIVETESRIRPEPMRDWDCLQSREYGASRLNLFRNTRGNIGVDI